jgi:lipopolysaccharide assembly outer membrane protein LptD (OstA)
VSHFLRILSGRPFLDTKDTNKKMRIMNKSELKNRALLVFCIMLLLWAVLAWTEEPSAQTEIQTSDQVLTKQEVLDSIPADSSYFVPDSLILDSIIPSDSTEVDSVFYSADSVYYSVENKEIMLSGNSNIQYHTSNIQSDTIKIDMKREQAFAKGKSFMKDGSQLILGDDVYYDMDTQWGLLSQGASKFDKGFYYGDEIRKVGKKTFDVDNGIFTTCDGLHPHFYIGTRQLRMYQNDKIVGKPIVFYVNHFPVMALPFGTFTIKRGRQSGILVPSPGWSDYHGKYLENIAYYYAYKDYADATLALDFYERTGWDLSLSSQYVKRYVFNGSFSATLQKNISGPDRSTNEWTVSSRHHHDFGNNTTFDSNLNFVSSSAIWEGSDDVTERLKEQITSSMAYKKPLLGSMLNISANYTHDLLGTDLTYVSYGDTITETVEKKVIVLPLVSYSLPSKPFYELFMNEEDEIPEEAWWKGFSYSYKFTAAQGGYTQSPGASFKDVIWDNDVGDQGTIINQHNAGVKHYGGIRYTYKWKGWLNLTQSVTGSETWFDRDKNGEKWVRGNDYNATSSLGFNVYGLRNLNTFYLKAIRHIITPGISFSYQPDFSENDRFYIFNGISLKSGKRQRSIAFSLDNTWQLKLTGTEKTKERKINDFFKINSDVSYNFENEGNGFSDISHSIDLNPNKLAWKFFTLDTNPSGRIYQDTYDLKLKEWNFNNWDWGVHNWIFDWQTSLDFSGDANYVDYFPVPENDFQTSRFFTSDSLNLEDERAVETIAQMESLNREKKNWSISLSHTYKTTKAQYEINDYSSDLRMKLSAKISKNWTVAYDNYINLETDEVVSHSFTITRNLHCWKVFFRYTQQGDYWNYRLQLFNIKLPDALKFRTSDHKQ